MPKAFLVAFILAGFVYQLAAQPPDVPKSLASPNRKLVLVAHAIGSQIYRCEDAWKFKAPDAKLFNDHSEAIGAHYAGPTWQSTNGSSVKGKLVSSVPSPDADAIPWLLLTAIDHSGEGVMSGVQSIQRLNTKGGKAPSTACDAAHRDQEVKVPYTADYYFYSN